MRRELSGGEGGLCQWKLKASTDRSQSDCIHEQEAKADCEYPIYRFHAVSRNRHRAIILCLFFDLIGNCDEFPIKQKTLREDATRCMWKVITNKKYEIRIICQAGIKCSTVEQDERITFRITDVR